jgi:transcriptional regulator with XRE-family HTH domain
MDFATNLKRLRTDAGLTQRELAAKAGLSMSLVVKIEQRRKADPRLSTIVALASALGVATGELIGESCKKRSRRRPPAIGGARPATAEDLMRDRIPETDPLSPFFRS